MSIAGPIQVRGTASAQFSASVAGLAGTGVNWSVNEISGGSPTIGTISGSGEYLAPIAAQTVTITVTSEADASAKASSSLEVINPLPEIASAAVVRADNGQLSVNVNGDGFIPQTSVSVGNAVSNSTYISQNELQIQLSQNQASGSDVSIVASNPSPGAADSNVVTVALPPSPIQDLHGCVNPNSAPSTSDWGSSNSAVYIPLSLQTAPDLNPQYSSNSIFWVSRETAPGQAVLLTGAFTTAVKSVRVAEIPPGTQDWTTYVQNMGVVQSTTQQNSTGLSFKIPSQMTQGVYGFEIDDPSTAPVYGLANLPQIVWALGVPANLSADQAFQAQIHDCGAEPGEILRIFGKNFATDSRLILESSSGSTAQLTPSAVDATSMMVQIPATTQPGTYYMWVGGLPWSPTSSPTSLITILQPRPLNVVSETCTGLFPDGQTDNSSALQLCLDHYAPSANSGKIVHIALPGGKYLLSSAVALHSYELIDGVSPSLTEFVANSPAKASGSWFSLPPYSGLADLSIAAPGATSVISTQDTSGDPQKSGHVFLSDLTVNSSPAGTSSAGTTVLLSGPDVEVYDSEFATGTSTNTRLSLADGAVVSNNLFDVRNGVDGLDSSQNVILEDNTFYSDTGVGANAVGALYMGRPFCEHCASRTSQNLYIAYNSFHDLGTIGSQVITEDGGAGAYYGTIASSSANTVQLSDDPSWDWSGNSNLHSMVIAIVSGTGVGEFSTLKSVNGRTLTLDSPWQVIPDSSSWVVVVFEQQNLEISHNSFKNTLGRTINIFDAVNSVIEDNTLTNSGDGIRIEALGPYGGPAGFGQTLNTDVLQNIITTGQGNFITPSQNNNIGGIGVMQGYGSLVSGLMIRSNSVPSVQSIYSTNGTTGISAVVIDGNVANWVGPVSPVPGFLSEDNTAP